MKYNAGRKYNLFIKDGGIGYNGMNYVFTVRLYDAITMNEMSLKTAAKLVFLEKFNATDFVENFVLHKHNESIDLIDKEKHFALFEFAEKINISDEFYKILVQLFLKDNVKVLDEFKKLNVLISKQDNFKLNEKEKLDALIKVSDKANLKDASKIFALIKQLDAVKALDKDPKKAISDFIIGKSDNLDNAYDWLIPFDMKINWSTSSIQIMPQTESTYIDMAGTDGSIISDTVYKNRLFSIVAYSDLGLSVYEKELLKKQIAEILDSTKNKTKKLTMQATGTSFDAKYSGAAAISEGPSFVKATIPFEVSPYGYPLFEQEVFGTGLLVNNGAADTGCVNKILSGVVNPSFRMGNIAYTWNGTVPENHSLIIDHESYSCYLESVKGNKTNVIDKLVGEFQKIPANSSVSITADNNTENYLITSLKEKILW